MKKLVFGALLAAIAMLLPAACSNTPANPTVSFTSPLASQPSTGTTYKFKDQPVTIAISNAVRTAASTATYTVEVATDPAFTNKVFTKSGITEGGGGTTSLAVSGLAGNATYYWHWAAVIDGVTSQWSNGQAFTVQQQIVINTPTTTNPANGVTATVARPTFVTNNATTQGAVGAISYLFQVSTVSNFSTIVTSATVPEQSGGVTSWTPTSDLPSGTLFWRVEAIDSTNAEVSPFSNPVSFVIQLFSMSQATIVNNPPDLASWAQTATISSIFFDGTYMDVDFDKRTGPDRWPESDFGVQYTLGMCFNLGNHWYCSAVIQFWDGRDLEASGPADEIGVNWYYGRWPPMDGHQPADGELVGVFVAQGNLRDSGMSTLHERSNVVLIPFGTSYFLNGTSSRIRPPVSLIKR